MTKWTDTACRRTIGHTGRSHDPRSIVWLRSLAMALSLTVVVAGCHGPPGQELAEVFDVMLIPDDWIPVSEELVDPPCLGDPTEVCPRAVRIYEAPSDPDFEIEARAMIEAAGLGSRSITDECQTGAPGCRVTSLGRELYVEATIIAGGNDTVTIRLRVTPP